MPTPRPHWSTVTVAGRECDLFSPPDPLVGVAVVYLHDLQGDSLRETPSLRDELEAARMPVIAPRAGRSWWLDRAMPGFEAPATPERFVVDSIRTELEHRCGVRPPGIALLGRGMGGQGALRLAYRHPAVFPIAAALSPSIDFHLAMREAGERPDGELFDTLWATYGDVERARQDTAILHVHPLNWPRHQFFASDPADAAWHDGAERLHSKLVALGIPHTALLHRGADTAADAVRFIRAALEQDSRRLPAT